MAACRNPLDSGYLANRLSTADRVRQLESPRFSPPCVAGSAHWDEANTGAVFRRMAVRFAFSGRNLCSSTRRVALKRRSPIMSVT